MRFESALPAAPEPGNDTREDKCFSVTDLLVSADWEQLEGKGAAAAPTFRDLLA